MLRPLVDDAVLLRCAVLGGLWVVLYAAAKVAAQGDDDALMVLGNVVYPVPIVLCSVLSVAAVTRASRAQRTFWLIMSASNGLWLAGEVVWSTYALALDRAPPFPSAADALCMSPYLLVFPAIAMGFRMRWPSSPP